MSRRFRTLFIVAGLLFAALPGLALGPLSAGGDDPAPKGDTTTKPSARKLAMKTFMRKKLEASQSLLEGLALEDFELIEAGARQLKATTAASEFMVVNDGIYRDHADEFRRIVAKIEKAAHEKRIDGATLGFVDMTLSCVECHKYSRTIRIAQ